MPHYRALLGVNGNCKKKKNISGNLPKAVRKRNSSPSLQNKSHTRHAVSKGNDLLNNVNILKNNANNN